MKESHQVDPFDAKTTIIRLTPSFEDTHCRRCPKAAECPHHHPGKCQRKGEGKK